MSLLEQPRVVKHPLTFRVFMRTVAACVPNGVKRLILLSSLIAYVINTKDPERELVRNMDSSLRLTQSSHCDSLRFGFLISQLFWGDRELFKNEIEVLTSCAARGEKMAAAEKIVRCIPQWFGYSERQQLAEEVSLYFSEHHPHLAM